MNSAPITIQDIQSAETRLMGHALPTPLIGHPALDEAAGRRVWIKCESLQKTGSFKYRGARNALAALPDGIRARGVIAVSSGNHAQGVALAAAEFGVPALIFMPKDAPAPKVEGTRKSGAKIRFYDRETEDRDALAVAAAKEMGRTLIRPFDEAQVIAGQGTVGLEIAQHARGLGLRSADVLVPCGGGGLSAGIALALAHEAPALRLRTVEPIGFDDTARSLMSGQREVNSARSGSICDAILTPSPGALTFPLLRAHAGPGLTVSDEACLLAMGMAARHLDLTLEPGGAAALAAALSRADDIQGPDVIVVASGGNVDPALLEQARQSIG